MDQQLNVKLSDWVENIQKDGRISFSIKQIRHDLPNSSAKAIKSSLRRLTIKGKIVSIHKGYYLIISPQYSSKGILPPAVYLDGFMKFLNKPYYVGLLSAAAFHGAAHQQPQEFFVVTIPPQLRPTVKRGIKVNYLCKKRINLNSLDERKTETGYLKISSPLLTALDLVQYEKRVGGLSRVVAVLDELIEEIKPEDIEKTLFDEVPISSLQRLGYLIEYVLENISIADKLYSAVKEYGMMFYRTPLKASYKTIGSPSNNRWKVTVNIDIDFDK